MRTLALGVLGHSVAVCGVFRGCSCFEIAFSFRRSMFVWPFLVYVVWRVFDVIVCVFSFRVTSLFCLFVFLCMGVERPGVDFLWLFLLVVVLPLN